MALKILAVLASAGVAYLSFRYGFAEIVASAAMILVSFLLYRVNRGLLDLNQRAQKNMLNPDLRVHVGPCHYVDELRKQYAVENEVGEAVPRVIQQLTSGWQVDMYLWNTGASSILVTDWEAVSDVFPAELSLSLLDNGRRWVASPPICIPAHSSVEARALIEAARPTELLFRFDTPQRKGREYRVPASLLLGR